MSHQLKTTLQTKLWERLSAYCNLNGVKPQDVVKQLIKEELERFDHIQRSQPKDEQPKKPVGRPADPFQIKQAKEWAERVRKPLSTCKSNQPEAYDLYVAWIESVVDQALAAGDAATLEDLYREQPWQSSQWPRKLEFQERYSQYISAS